MLVNVSPDLRSDEAVADGIKMAGAGGSVVESSAQAELFVALPRQRVTHGNTRNTVLFAQCEHFLLQRIERIVVGPKKGGCVDDEESRPICLFETEQCSARDSSSL